MGASGWSGWWRRAVKVLLEPAQNPVASSLSAPERQRQLRRDLEAALERVAAAKRQLRSQAGQLRDRATVLQAEAERLVADRSEGRARCILQIRQAILREATALDRQAEEVEREEAGLKLAEQRLAARLESYRAQCDVLEARQTAADAGVQVGAVMSGMVEIAGELHQALERAEESAERLDARAAAIRELMGSGVLPQVPRDAFLEKDLADDVENEIEGLREKTRRPD